ncbi:MAG: sulfatase [Kiritimatiellae bacterium]|nr:sulfatase [Kiritimatiellia bacterium]
MPAKKKPNVLLMAVDSLLSTHMSCYGYPRLTTPHIDRFAREAVLFENTFSPHIPTTSGYASMLTGRDVFGTQVVALRHRKPLTRKIRTLPEILRRAGYNTTCVGFKGNAASRGFDTYLGYSAWGSSAEERSPKAGNLNAVALPELDRLARARKPFLLMLRHMDPHSPYLPPKPFDRLFYQGDECNPKSRSMVPVMAFKPFADYFASWMPPGITDKDYVIAQYDGAIAYMDACIQQIFTQLRTLGILDDTIVVLNSDHGETLYDHECWFDHHGLYDNTLRVPLIIRYPAKLPAGLRVHGYNQHKNLLPTLLQLAGVKADSPFDGESLLRLVRGERASFESSFYITECTWMRKHGWRTPQWKLIVALEPDFHFKPPVELYNLIEDPGENRNLATKHPAVVKALQQEMQAHIERRTRESGEGNPIANQPGWHGKADIDYFESSQQAYDTLHIGNANAARKLQAGSRAGSQK